MKIRNILEENWRTWPNFFTALRLLLFFPFIFFVFKYKQKPELLNLAAIIIIGIAGSVTDYLDGFLARKLQLETLLGRYFDAIVDKIIAIGSFYILTKYFIFPVWVFRLYLFREIGGIILVLFLFTKRHVITAPNFWGKLGVNIAVVMVFWYISQDYLSQFFNNDSFLRQPEISAYLFIFSLTMGVFQYAGTYFPHVTNRGK